MPPTLLARTQRPRRRSLILVASAARRGSRWALGAIALATLVPGSAGGAGFPIVAVSQAFGGGGATAD